jgi:hypothetical protein
VRSFYADQKMLRRDSQIRQHPVWRSEAEFVTAFVSRLRSATAPEDYFRLHEALLVRFLGTQTGIRDLRAQHGQMRGALREARETGESVQVREQSDLIGAIKWYEESASALLSIYRSLADAMVWYCVEFNRGAITCLGDGERVGWLSDGSGLESELSELHSRWTEDGVFSVLADMTNCVRCCDLLSIEQWQPRRLGLTESKAGMARGSRSSRQQERLDRLTTLLNDGSHPTAAPDGGPLTLVMCPSAAKTNFAEIDGLLQEAKADTCAAREVEEGVLVEAFDERDPAGLGSIDLRARHDEWMRRLGWEEADCLPYGVQFRRLRDHRQDSFSSQLPISLLPFDPEDVAGLLLGDLDYVTTVNATILERRLSHGGRRAKVARGAAAGESFLTVERGLQRSVVPAPDREMLLIEGLSIPDLDARIQWNLDEGARQRLAKRTMAMGFAADLEIFGRSVRLSPL